MIRRTVTHPKIYKHVTDDYSPPACEYQPLMSEALVYLGVWDAGGEFLGLFAFHPYTPCCWEMHTCLLPAAWGRAAEAAQGAWQWMWANTEARRIIGSAPASNRLALRYAERAGMRHWGVNPKSFLKDGVLEDQVWLGVSKGE